MFFKRLLLIVLISCASQVSFSQEIYVSSQDFKLYKVDIKSCKSDFICNIRSQTTDISFHPNGKLYGISNNGNLFEINIKTGASKVITDFDGQSFNSLTISSTGIIYCLGNYGILWSYNLEDGLITNHGNVGYEATGDITFFKGELYAAVTEDRIIKINIEHPEKSKVAIQGDVEGKIFGIVSFAESCSDIEAFTLTDGLAKIHKIDFENKTLSFVCELGFSAYGGASTYEFLGSATLKIEKIETLLPSCDTEGKITIHTTGGFGQTKYSLDGINYQLNNTFQNLKNGLLSVYVKDENECILNQTIDLNNSNNIELTIANQKDETCHGEDGSIQVLALGASDSLLYALNEGEFGISNTFNHLKKGSYTIKVKDQSGCIYLKTAVINLKVAPQISKVQAFPTSCGYSNGRIEIKVISNGTFYSSLDNFNFGKETVFEDLSMGEHKIFVKNDYSCVDSISVKIGDSKALRIGAIKSINPTCTENFGSLEIIEFNGEDDILYSIDGRAFQTENKFTNLEANKYRAKVKNAEGCIGEQETEIKAPPKLRIGNLKSTVATCGKANGQLSFEIEGNIGPLHTVINENRIIQGTSIDSLWSGSYRISISDEKGCEIDTIANVGQGDCPIHIPSSFSPNEDGQNDWYKIFTDASFNGELLSFEVFSRSLRTQFSKPSVRRT
jgi:hypothetical protein